MGFCVINTVKAPKDELAEVIVTVQRLGLDVLVGQPGFKQARLLRSEDLTEAMLFMEWDTRDDFVAYRQSAVGHKLVDGARSLHPHISFFEVITSINREPGS